jgi:cytochrome c biogenesis protein CcmG/thiol:disulfide interchange protein DsbE
MQRLRLFVPLLLCLALGLLLARGLQLDPQALPSAMIDQPFPEFSIAALGSGQPLTRAALVGEPALLNVWASWCPSCRVEHPYLQRLADQGVPLYGLNYKDSGADALAWLGQLGDPYRLSIADIEGSLGLDLGVYGAPETYVLDREGVIRYRHVGIVNEQVWSAQLKPLLQQLGWRAN